MLNLSSKTDAADVTKLSDQELLQTLAQQARELNIAIDLSYTFAQQPPAAKTDGRDIGPVIDHESKANKR